MYICLFILVILGEFLARLLLVMFGRPAAWHRGMFNFTWMFIFHVKLDINCSLYVRRLGIGF